MKPDISALLDDELEQSEASRAIDALRRDKELQEAWNAYHMIGDALRRSPEYSPHFSQRVMARLAEEPVLFAPSVRPRRAPLRFALPLAAAVMGMAAVGWVALSLNAPQPVEQAAKPNPANEQAVLAIDKSPSGALKEYLVAHQAHSPSGGIQGVAPYVRTVSEIRQSGRP
ncbi:MAG: sigma-E factor negative regulatory protein [Rhodocyclales bacterium]|nr:sigma-E factor negative regulatory protein [Rhodocyclales bacterium]